MATTFLTTLVNRLEMSWSNVAIVPGNHDVDWRTLEDRFPGSRLPKDQLRQCAACADKMENFSQWIDRLRRSKGYKHRYSFAQPTFFRAVSSQDLVVVGLDTCEALTHKHSSHHGKVGRRQLQKACGFLRSKKRDVIKVVLMHHNPFVHEGADNPSGLRSPGRVIVALCNAGANLVLAGHMHRPQHVINEVSVATGKSVCHTFVTGPCCMSQGGRRLILGEKYNEVLPNRYQIIQIETTSLHADIMLRRFSFEKVSSRDGVVGDWTNDTDPRYADEVGMTQEWLDPKMSKASRTLEEKMPGTRFIYTPFDQS